MFGEQAFKRRSITRGRGRLDARADIGQGGKTVAAPAAFQAVPGEPQCIVVACIQGGAKVGYLLTAPLKIAGNKRLQLLPAGDYNSFFHYLLRPPGKVHAPQKAKGNIIVTHDGSPL